MTASVVSLGELAAGVLLARDGETRARRLRLLSAVRSGVPTLPVDDVTAMHYGELRAATGRRPANDLWIAATALAHDLELITRDPRFKRLPHVRVRLLR